MKKAKFNPNNYMGKDRIYQAITGYQRISRIYVWNKTKRQYENPPIGKNYLAARYEISEQGNRKRVYGHFESLENALAWQAGKEVGVPLVDHGITFREVIEKWKKRKLSQKAISTKVAYEKIIRLYFGSLLNKPMKLFDSRAVDAWIDELKDPKGKFMKSNRRIAFDHELSLLSGILTYYREYEDNAFLHPIFGRHQDDVRTDRKKKAKKKDLNPAQFHCFLTELRKQKNGRLLSVLATVQYYQALRVSEVAALYWEDVLWNQEIPLESRLAVQRSVIFAKKKGESSIIQSGFKNSEANDGMKEQPIFPETYFALRSIADEKKMGPIFTIDGHHLEYRQIQYAYDQAFEAAELPFRGTHIMRHGGTRFAYNSTRDLEVAKQLLGNTDLQTVTIYAQRDAGALSQFAKARWESDPNLLATASKSV